MDELIELLRALARHEHSDVSIAEEAADALEAARGEVEYEYEVWQDGVLQAGGREADYASAKSEASHYAAMHTPDGPVEVRIYEKRLLSAEQRSQPKHSPYNPSGSLSEYGVFPECDAQMSKWQPIETAPYGEDRQ